MAEEEEIALQHLQAQSEHLQKIQDKRKMELEMEKVRRVEMGEAESIVEITMDTSVMDYSIVEEQGRLPDVLSKEENRVYAHLVQVEWNNIQW